MISVEEAMKRILAETPLLEAERAPIAQASGRVLAEDIGATTDNPPFDNSAMDGFAVRVRDLKGASRKKPMELDERETIRAGDFPREEVREGEAVRIMTGAQVPPGTEAVVMQEMTEPGGGGKMRFLHEPKPGEHIRKAGEDIRRGDGLLKAGIRLRPYEVALLAGQGIAEVEAVRKPRLGYVVTGDELVAPESPLSPGRIRNANGPAIASALARWGIAAEDGGIVPDQASVIGDRIGELLERCDVVLVSGGVSVGEFDLCRQVFHDLGVREVFWGVAIKPGKPLFFGVHGASRRRIVFGMPGNPVSVLVCLEEFVRPALEKMQGYTPEHSGFRHEGKVVNGYPKPSDRQRFLFCQVAGKGGEFELTVMRPQGAAMVGMACRANALAKIPAGSKPVRKGDKLAFRWLK